MSVDPVREVAQAVLYEGYLLWPYRRSALKNRHRWTLGGILPRAYSQARGGDDPYRLRTECLLEAAAGDPLRVTLRFLHVVTRDVARYRDGVLEPVPELVVAGQRHLAWEEATEREVRVAVPALRGLRDRPYRRRLQIPAGGHTEPLGDPPAGAVVRRWQALRGQVEVRAARCGDNLYRVGVEVVNTTACPRADRSAAMERSFVSAHVVLHCPPGRFVSLMDPPPALRDEAQRCRNTGVWPVLAGPDGDRSTVLAAPIILYDHPRVAPESPGDLFDATEVDQLLTLSILGLTEQEQQEMRDSDPRAREILDRCAALTPEQLMRLHGTLREVVR